MNGQLRLFLLPPALCERIERSAESEGKGGWQDLCAGILRHEVDLTGRAKQAKLEGIDAAIQNLQALRAAEEDEG